MGKNTRRKTNVLTERHSQEDKIIDKIDNRRLLYSGIMKARQLEQKPDFMTNRKLKNQRDEIIRGLYRVFQTDEISHAYSIADKVGLRKLLGEAHDDAMKTDQQSASEGMKVGILIGLPKIQEPETVKQIDNEREN